MLAAPLFSQMQLSCPGTVSLSSRRGELQEGEENLCVSCRRKECPQSGRDQLLPPRSLAAQNVICD